MSKTRRHSKTFGANSLHIKRRRTSGRPDATEIECYLRRDPEVADKKVPRNAPCPCGSEKKSKRCHG